MRTINITLSSCPGGTTPNRKGESTWILIQFIRFSRDFSLNFNHQEQHISKIKVQNLFSLQHEMYSTWNKMKQILAEQQHMEQTTANGTNTLIRVSKYKKCLTYSSSYC